MINFKNIIFFGLFISFVLSCNKDEDTSIPVIDVISPVDNELFNVKDTIPVIAEISDNRIIKHIQVNLVNENFTPVANSYNSYPDSKKYNLNINYILEDSTLENGTYYILVKAENESKFKNYYRKIRLKGETLKLKNVIVVTGKGEQLIKINTIDTSGGVSQQVEISCNYAASTVSSRFRQFYLAGKSAISLRAYSLPGYSVDWNLQTAIVPPIHNDNCLFADEYVFATYNSLYIRGYDKTGSVIFTTDITSHEKPGAVFRLNDYLIVDMQKQNSAGTPELVTYYIKSGLKMQTRQTQFKVSAFFKHSDNKVFITANGNGYGQLFIYNVELDMLEHLADLEGEIVSSDIIDNNRIIAGTDMMIYIYDYSTMQLLPFMDDIATRNIVFEPLNGNLYISTDITTKKYKFPEMILQGTYIFDDTIKNVHLLYNK